MFKQVIHYQTKDGKIPFREWLSLLKDVTIKSRISARIDRLLRGNFGDSKSIGNGIFELRFHFASGYRVYFGIDHGVIVILLLGGDKSSQQNDIYRSRVYWLDYLRRSK